MQQLFCRFALALCLGLTLSAIIAAPASLAQTQEQPAPRAIDYEAWQNVAGRAEEAIDEGRASNDAFEALRAEIVAWRDQFLRAQTANTARITTIRDQLASLGPAPAEGETEAPEIAQRRAELNAQLADATAPVRRAEEAFSRADGLAREIDTIIRERQASELLLLGPSPLNPFYWPEATGNLVASVHGIAAEPVQALRSDAKREALLQVLPLTLLAAAAALVLSIFGEATTARLTRAAVARAHPHARSLVGFFVSLSQIAVPVMGLALLAEVAQGTGLLGFRGTIVADLLPLLGLCFFGARWLGRRLFPSRSDRPAAFNVTPEQGRAMRRSIVFVGLFVGLTILMARFSDYENYSDATTAVLRFPLATLAGLGLMRIGRVLRLIGRQLAEDEELKVYGARGLVLVGRTTVILGVIGIAMAAVGYLNAAFFMLLPTTLSLAMIGVLLLLTEPIRDAYALVTGTTPEEARAALIPTLANFLLVLTALPVFALIWGARTADLTELWAQFKEGFSIGETRISPTNFLTFALIFTGLYLATRIIQGALRNTVLPKTSMDVGGQNAIVSGIGYVGIFLAAVVSITSAGIDLSSLAIVAGALSVGIGFGLQNIVQNFVSGIILLIERPVAEGDWIEVGGHTGIVKKISVRSTLIETFDRTEVVVPNGDFISGSVTNWTRSNHLGRVMVNVGVAYGTDTRKVAKILMEIVENHPLVTVTPAPGVDFMGFGADSLDFRIRAVIRDINFGVGVKTELHHQIAERFAQEGIEIPFAQRDVWLRNPEALTGMAPAAETAEPVVRADEAAPPGPQEGQRRGISNDGLDDDDEEEAR